MAAKQKKKFGLAALSPERRREIARMGAQAIHERGTAYQYDSDAGREAGLKSGKRRKKQAKARAKLAASAA